MENIFYKIKEKINDSNENKKVDTNELLEEINEQFFPKGGETEKKINSDMALALEIEYNTNYNVKDLGKILDYYEINKRKLRKDEMIQLIILFEEDSENMEIVSRRRRLWENIKELKEDKYFCKYILFG